MENNLLRKNHKIHLLADVSRCPNISSDFEKIIMVLVMRKLNRKNKGSTISSEQKIQNSEDIADIKLEHKDKTYYYEIQKEFSKEYCKRIADRDLNTDTETIIIPLKPLIKKYKEFLENLSKDLEDYILCQPKKR
jgi:predicted nuclease of restriction endonuclease-like RecB superfamily